MTTPAAEVVAIWVDGDLSADVVESHAVIEDPDEPRYLTVCGRIMSGGYLLDPAVGSEGSIFIDRACDGCWPAVTG